MLAAGGTIHQESSADGGGPITPGWGKTQCTGPIKGSVLFRSYQQGVAIAEASVSTMTPATKFVTFASELTGLAYGNPSAEPAAVTFTAIDSAGTKRASATLTVPVGMHGATFIRELLGLQNFIGSIQIVSSVPIVTYP